MSAAEKALLVVAVLGAAWQAFIFAQVVALLSRPGIRNVRFGILPGLVALAATVALVVML